MPVKRRTTKNLRRYPEPIEQLLAGGEVDDTPDARQRMVEIVYFGDWEKLPPEAVARARELLREWPPVD